jgi:hypothetical protein
MAFQTRLCEICRKEIPAERLEVLPETRLCVEHAQMMRKYGGEFIVHVHQERVSKPGSLKRNYGGVTISKTRNQSALDKLRREYEGQHDEAEGKP